MIERALTETTCKARVARDGSLTTAKGGWQLCGAHVAYVGHHKARAPYGARWRCLEHGGPGMVKRG